MSLIELKMRHCREPLIARSPLFSMHTGFADCKYSYLVESLKRSIKAYFGNDLLNRLDLHCLLLYI